MKTTIDINDALLIQAKQLAAERQQSLKSILEAALRQFLAQGASPQPTFKLRKHPFRGQGLQPHLATSDWEAISRQIYAGRGE